MKGLTVLAIYVMSFVTFAAEYDGVQLNCLEVAQKRMSKDKSMSLVAVCRSRNNPNQEWYTFSDGSSMTGFTADSLNKCKLLDWWNGQDDQDQTDPKEWKKECLVEDDFKTTEVKTTLKSEKDTNFKLNIPNAEVYYYTNETKNRKNIEFAEAIGKNIRRSYYQKGYSIESHSYQEVGFDTMISFLEKSEGEFRKLRDDQIAEVYSWYEDKHVAKIYMMNLDTQYMSGTGLEQVFILIPDVKDEGVLAITRFFYAE